MEKEKVEIELHEFMDYCTRIDAVWAEEFRAWIDDYLNPINDSKLPQQIEKTLDNMEKKIEIRQKIVDELVQWNCIEFNSDIIGITDAIMEIINPLITDFDSKRAQNTDEQDINISQSGAFADWSRV